VLVSDDGMVAKDHSGHTVNALAFRTWDGRIQFSTKLETELQEYTAIAKQAHPERLVKALEEHANAIYEYRVKVARKAGKKWPEIRGTLPTGDEQHRKIIDLKIKADSAKMVVHEVLHGFSPLESSAYRGAAGQIEEITTEVMARVVSRDVLGIPMLAHTQGSYAWDVEAATNAIAELTGKPAAQAYEDLQRAAERFKRRTMKYTRAADVSAAFAEDVAHVTRTSMLRAEDVMDRHLAGVTARRAAAP
jgi:hypothetical protein